MRLPRSYYEALVAADAEDVCSAQEILFLLSPGSPYREYWARLYRARRRRLAESLKMLCDCDGES